MGRLMSNDLINTCIECLAALPYEDETDFLIAISTSISLRSFRGGRDHSEYILAIENQLDVMQLLEDSGLVEKAIVGEDGKVKLVPPII